MERWKGFSCCNQTNWRIRGECVKREKWKTVQDKANEKPATVVGVIIIRKAGIATNKRPCHNQL